MIKRKRRLYMALDLLKMIAIAATTVLTLIGAETILRFLANS